MMTMMIVMTSWVTGGRFLDDPIRHPSRRHHSHVGLDSTGPTGNDHHSSSWSFLDWSFRRPLVWWSR